MTNPYSAPAADLSFERSGADQYQPRIFAWTGRIGRLRYLGYAFLIFLLGMTVVGTLFGLLAVMGHGRTMVLAPLVSYCLLFVFIVAPAKRRFNDMNRSGWFALLLLVPLVSFFATLSLVFGRGTDGPNDYGPMPCKNPRGMAWLALVPPMMVVIGMVVAMVLPKYLK